MNIEEFGLVDLLFRHKSTQHVQALGRDSATKEAIPVGRIFASVDEECFSRRRPPTAKKQIKCSGASRLVDFLFYEREASIYSNGELGQVYVEFLANGKTYHMLCQDGKVFFAESDIGCRYHRLFAFLGKWIQKNLNPRLHELLMQISRDSKGGDACFSQTLAFDDEFYYFGKTTDALLEVNVGDGTLLAEVQAAFRANAFHAGNRIGTLESEFERLNQEGKEEKKGESRKTGKKTGRDALFQDIKSGKHILDYGWPEEQKPFIIPLSFLEEYVPDDNFFDMFNIFDRKLRMALKRVKEGDMAAKKKDAVNVFLLGKPGTGKTYMLHALAAAFGFPIRITKMGKNSEEDDYEGMNKIIDGELTAVQTPFLKNAHMGGITVIEEINLADPDVVMGAIGQYVEYPFTIYEQGYQPVQRHPLNIICGTFNVGTAGSKDISEALSSRFPPSYVLDDPSREDFICRLMVDGYGRDVCSWVYDIYEDVIETLKSPDYNCEEYTLNVTFRACYGALQCMEAGDSPKRAIYHTMIGKIAEKDMDIANRIWQEVVEPKPNYFGEIFER